MAGRRPLPGVTAGTFEEAADGTHPTILRRLRSPLLPDAVDPKDPVFHAFPLLRSPGKKTWYSRDHDDLLYPARR